MKNKLSNIIKSKTVSYPLYIYKNRVALDLNDSDFVMLTYLLDIGDNQALDIEKFSRELNMETGEIFERIESLKEKNFIDIKTIDKEKNIKEDIISFSKFYKKLIDIIINEDEVIENNSIYKKVEEGLGRLLTPIEIEHISSWIDKGLEEELILEALKIAVLNGVTNLNYINKILSEWDQKGIKTLKELDNKDREVKKIKEEEEEIFDYNWLD